MEFVNQIQDLVLDTPNSILYHAHRGKKQVEMNKAALLNFLITPREFDLHPAITPMMKKRFPKLVWLISKISNSNGIFTFETKGDDPDISIITHAKTIDAYILSNDKFRQYPRFQRFIRDHRFSFEIIQNQIITEATS